MKLIWEIFTSQSIPTENIKDRYLIENILTFASSHKILSFLNPILKVSVYTSHRTAVNTKETSFNTIHILIQKLPFRYDLYMWRQCKQKKSSVLSNLYLRLTCDLKKISFPNIRRLLPNENPPARGLGGVRGGKPFGPTIFYWQRVLNDLYSRGPQGSDPRPPPLFAREGRKKSFKRGNYPPPPLWDRRAIQPNHKI
jgi:hypothetical protein